MDGLNQLFPVRRVGRRVSVAVADDAETRLGEPILRAVDVDGPVQEILSGSLELAGEILPFADAVKKLEQAYRENRRIDPVPSKLCGSCEFRAAKPPQAGEPRSGFHECWSARFGWTEKDFGDSSVLDLWNFAKKDDLIAQGVLKLKQLTEEDLNFDGSEPGAEGMTRRHRQWYQCSQQWPGAGDHYLDADGLARAMRDWRYPLHFIDFETCAVAIPFNRGHRPYETVAFQFSHHVMQADGSVAHQSQFLQAIPGKDPNIDFLRALRTALGDDDGTVFRWATHENTVLNQLRQQLLDDPHPPADAPELIAFVETLTERKQGKARLAGPRVMVDLCLLAERHYFHPSTRGSSSLKKVLPALMSSSPFLRELYSQPVYGSQAMPSLNLTQPQAWWIQSEGGIRDPYSLLPPVFDDISAEELAEIDAGFGDELKEGGAAMAAYARLQFESLDMREREAIEAALLRYCELDTLAMVMAVQAWVHDDCR